METTNFFGGYGTVRPGIFPRSSHTPIPAFGPGGREVGGGCIRIYPLEGAGSDTSWDGGGDGGFSDMSFFLPDGMIGGDDERPSGH